MKKTIFLWLGLSVFCGCSKESDAYQDIPLTFETPSNFPEPVYDFASNLPTQSGFELGKKLFYDGRLSSDGVISCGFCHIQQDAFTHHGHTVSHGVDNLVGMRNTPSLQNLAFQSVFMYDGAIEHLDLQPVAPLTNPVEMNGNLATIVVMLKNDPEYKKMFRKAFPDSEINSENMLKALGQFMVMMQSANSRFDKFRRSEPGGTMTATELEGYAVFNAKCVSCHATDLFTDNSFRNNGLPVNPLVNDTGRFGVTQFAPDKYKFKVPSLRNIEKTAPYMHDGRFGTLEAVLNHYASGIVNSATLDPILSANGTLGIVLSATEKTQLTAFLKTLTDTDYLTDSRYSEF